MENSDGRYEQIPPQDEDAKPVGSRRRWKVGVTIIGVSCLLAAMLLRSQGGNAESGSSVNLAFDASPEAIAKEMKKCADGGNRVFLDGAPLGNSGAKLVAEKLHLCENLEFLQLTECQIGDDGVIALSQALQAKPLPKMREFFLGRNAMTDVGAEELAKCLPVLPSLQRLYLNENQIADDGASALAKAWPTCFRLEDTFLGMNQIGDVGATRIAEGLSKSPSMLRLYLNKLKFGEEGGKALAAGRLGCKTLKVLGVYDNNLPEYLLPKLAVAGKYVPADTKDDKKMKMQQNRMMMNMDSGYDDSQ